MRRTDSYNRKYSEEAIFNRNVEWCVTLKAPTSLAPLPPPSSRAYRRTRLEVHARGASLDDPRLNDRCRPRTLEQDEGNVRVGVLPRGHRLPLRVNGAWGSAPTIWEVPCHRIARLWPAPLSGMPPASRPRYLFPLPQLQHHSNVRGSLAHLPLPFLAWRIRSSPLKRCTPRYRMRAQSAVFGLSVAGALTATHVLHGLITFVLLHWIKGTPDTHDQVSSWAARGVWSEQLGGEGRAE